MKGRSLEIETRLEVVFIVHTTEERNEKLPKQKWNSILQSQIIESVIYLSELFLINQLSNQQIHQSINTLINQLTGQLPDQSIDQSINCICHMKSISLQGQSVNNK